MTDNCNVQYEINVHEINPKFNHYLYGTIEIDCDYKYLATYLNEMYEEHELEKTFNTFEMAENWVLDKINKAKNEYIKDFALPNFDIKISLSINQLIP